VRLLLRHQAKGDLLEALAWYERQRPGLGADLRDEIDVALASIRDHPELYGRVDERVRRAPLRRFPYGVFYVVQGDTVRVIAVLHHARDPAVWRDRR
jgi:toxin ParE1/3/4